MRSLLLLPLLLCCFAGCSSSVDTSGLESELAAANKRIAELEKNSATLAQLEGRLILVEQQAAGNMDTLQGHSALQTKLTESVAASIARSTQTHAGLLDLIKANTTKIDQMKVNVDGNRELIKGLLDTVKTLLK